MSNQARVILDLFSAGLYGKLFADLTPEELADMRARTDMREEVDSDGSQGEKARI